MSEFYQTATPTTTDHCNLLPQELSEYLAPCHAAPNVEPDPVQLLSCWHCKTKNLVDLISQLAHTSGINAEENPHLTLKAQVTSLTTGLTLAMEDLHGIITWIRGDTVH